MIGRFLKTALRSTTTQFSRFIDADKGNVSLIFGLAAVPFAMVATLAFDMANINRTENAIQNAADSAVLAAATAMASGQSDADKTIIAEQMFARNVDGKIRSGLTATPVTDVDYANRTVTMTVDLQIKEAFSQLFSDHTNLRVVSKAVVDHGNPICMMALNPTASDALLINGTADVKASECAVHVNSNATDAMTQVGSSKATAEAFCVTGEFSGTNYSPPPRNHCNPENDPLAETLAAAMATLDTTSCQTVFDNTKQLQSDQTINPGVYCGGLDFKQGTFHLNPGIYVIRDDEFYVSAQSTLIGDGVTIVLTGDSNTRFVNQGGANLNLTAPATGPFSGFVIVQDPNTVPDKSNIITGGGYMKLEGLVYLPSAPLTITGNGIIGQDSRQLAMMANTIEVAGTGLLEIRIGSDYMAAGLPKLPEANEVVRLAE